MKWNVIKALSPARCHVSISSGVYCFMKSEIISGLKTGTEPIYVGKSKNIRSRLNQHLSSNQCHNHKLLIDLIKQSGRSLIEFYYMEVPEPDLDKLERDLILKLKPSHNLLLTGV